MFLLDKIVVPIKLIADLASTKPPKLTSLCVTLAALLVLAACAGNATGGETATAVDIDRHEPGQIDVGDVTFLAGFDLELDEPAFGGLSGLVLTPDGSGLVAVSDGGWWITADLQHDNAGHLTGVSNLAVVPMLDTDGSPISDLSGDLSKIRGDAESVANDEDGGFLVSFEREHRVWSYADLTAQPVVIDLPPDVSDLGSNSALESVAQLPDGRLVIFAERPTGDESLIKGWIREADGWRSLTYLPRDDFSVTDIAALPDGRVIALERWFVAPVFLKIRLREIMPDMLDTDAPIDGRILATFTNPLLIDNFEGLAARPAPDGGTLLYMVSDDNFNGHQRTLLYQFHLAP